MINTRHVARGMATVAALFSGVMLVATLGSGGDASAAGTNGGSLRIVVPPASPGEGQPLTAGGSATQFALTPPAGAACKGDSATGGYRVQSFVVPASIDPGTLTFDANGPIPAGTGANLRIPLFSATGTPFVNATTAVSTGLLTGLPAFSFSFLGAGGAAIIPPGVYNVGVACTLGPASATQQDKFWSVQMTFAATPTDPSGITWTAPAAAPPPSSTTTTSTTSTTTPGSTTTTTHPTTTTTSTSSSTSTSTSSSTSTTVKVASAGPVSGSGTGSTSTSTRLVRTGSSSSLKIVIWAILLLVFGRMAILLGKRVVPPGKL